jgi:hypothetical protein
VRAFFLDDTMRKLFKLAKRWVPLLAGFTTVLKNVADLIDKILK